MNALRPKPPRRTSRGLAARRRDRPERRPPNTKPPESPAPCVAWTCSPASAAMRRAWRGPASPQSRSVSSTNGAAATWPGSSRECRSMKMSVSSPAFPPMSLSADRPASERQWPLPFTASEMASASGPTCSPQPTGPAQNGLSWSSPPAMRRGKPKSLTIFADLAATSPGLNSALATLVRRISAGECTYLPAPACRDWRSPGDRSHPRLTAPRGQQMPEVIGTRISSPLYEWMLGVPAKWTEPSAPSARSA